MNFQTYTQQTIPVIQPEGRFDAYQVPTIETWLDEHLSTQPYIIIDMQNVRFTDTRALSLLVKYMKKTREKGGDLKLCNVSEPVQVILELSRLNQALMVYDTVEAAASACNALLKVQQGADTPPPQAEITNTQRLYDGASLLLLTGRVDAFRIPNVQKEIDALIDQGSSRFVVDLTEVEFLDSAGLALLVKLLKQLRSTDGKMALVRSKYDDANRILSLTQFDKVFHMADTQAAAIQYVTS